MQKSKILLNGKVCWEYCQQEEASLIKPLDEQTIELQQCYATENHLETIGEEKILKSRCSSAITQAENSPRLKLQLPIDEQSLKTLNKMNSPIVESKSFIKFPKLVSNRKNSLMIFLEPPSIFAENSKEGPPNNNNINELSEGQINPDSLTSFSPPYSRNKENNESEPKKKVTKTKIRRRKQSNLSTSNFTPKQKGKLWQGIHQHSSHGSLSFRTSLFH